MIFSFNGSSYISTFLCNGYTEDVIFDTGCTISTVTTGVFGILCTETDVSEFKDWLIKRCVEKTTSTIADGSKRDIYLCYARNVTISNFTFTRFYFYLTFAKKSLILLGDDVINVSELSKNYMVGVQEIECNIIDYNKYLSLYNNLNAEDITYLFTGNIEDDTSGISSLFNKSHGKRDRVKETAKYFRERYD